MMQSVFFKIADHILHVKIPVDFPLMDYLPSFNSFLISDSDVNTISLLEIIISNNSVPEPVGKKVVLADNSPIWGNGFRFEEDDMHYITTMHMLDEASKVCMISSKEFRSSTIYLSNNDTACLNLIGWFIMVAFGQGVLPYKTIMIHASTVERNQEEAYAFLGKSGTGKSTHSQLWLKYLNGFTLLNDDNPAIRIFENHKVYIYGTPWSGKTSCYRDLKVRLRGFVRLQQAQINKFELKINTKSLILLLPSCTAIRWNKNLFNNMVNTVESIIKVVPVGMMECQINQEAANVSYQGIKLKTLSYE